MQLRHGGRRYSLSAAEFVIGSAPEATLRLTGEQVFGRHLAVRQAASDAVVVERAHPDAIIEVNGQVVGADHVQLASGDRLVVGHHWIEVVDQDLLDDSPPSPSTSSIAPPAPQDAARPGRLVSLATGKEFQLSSEPFVIGRGAAAHLALESGAPIQAQIVAGPEGDVLVDLSGGAIQVNGVNVEGRQRLRRLDVIRIGAEELRYYPAVRIVEVDQPPLTAAFRVGGRAGDSFGVAAPVKTKPLAILRVKRGAARGQRFAVVDPVVTIGRGMGNDIVLTGQTVGISHARLELRDKVWSLVENDLGLETLVDGIPVMEEMPLSPGATIVLGDAVLSFEPQDEVRTRSSDLAQSQSRVGTAQGPATGSARKSGDGHTADAEGPGADRNHFSVLPGRTRPQWWLIGFIALAVIAAAAVFWYLF